MSRGLGRRERELLHEVYEHDDPKSLWGLAPYFMGSTKAESNALTRAARSLIRKGLIESKSDQWANNLRPLDPVPDAVARVLPMTTCGKCAK